MFSRKFRVNVFYLTEHAFVTYDEKPYLLLKFSVWYTGYTYLYIVLQTIMRRVPKVKKFGSLFLHCRDFFKVLSSESRFHFEPKKCAFLTYFDWSD